METVINSLKSKSDTDNVLSKLKGFHLSLNFAVDKFDDGVVHHLNLKIIDNEQIFIIKIHILVNTWTFPVTHPGIQKELGLKPCIIELQKYVVIRNY